MDEMTKQIQEGRLREQMEMFPDIPQVFKIAASEIAANTITSQINRPTTVLNDLTYHQPIYGVTTFEEVAQSIFDECFDLLIQRQVRYGPTNIDQQGPWGVLSRIANDKLARIKRAFNGRVVHGDIDLDPITDADADESYEDAVKDLVNYGVILLLLHRGLWGKPLEQDVSNAD